MSVDAKVLAIIMEAAEEYEQPEKAVAESHGDAAIPKLLECLDQWKLANAACGELARYPLETKLEKIIPAALERAVAAFCDGHDPSNCGFEIERLIKHLIKELVHIRDLPERFVAAVGGRKLGHRVNHFISFVEASRDPVLSPLLAGMGEEYHWGNALLALEAKEHLADVLATLIVRKDYNDWELGLAAGLFGGESARQPLLDLFEGDGYRKDGYALGLAFIADPADAALFKKLSTKEHGGTAKRIYAILTAKKQKPALTTLEKTAKNADLPVTFLWIRLLEHDDGALVFRAAELFADYAADRGKHGSKSWHLSFLRAARRAVEAGKVDPAMHELLEAVRETIPGAEPLPAPSADATQRAATDAPAAKGAKGAKGQGAKGQGAKGKAGPDVPRRPRHVIRW